MVSVAEFYISINGDETRALLRASSLIRAGLDSSDCCVRPVAAAAVHLQGRLGCAEAAQDNSVLVCMRSGLGRLSCVVSWSHSSVLFVLHRKHQRGHGIQVLAQRRNFVIVEAAPHSFRFGFLLCNPLVCDCGTKNNLADECLLPFDVVAQVDDYTLRHSGLFI